MSRELIITNALNVAEREIFKGSLHAVDGLIGALCRDVGFDGGPDGFLRTVLHGSH